MTKYVVGIYYPISGTEDLVETFDNKENADVYYEELLCAGYDGEVFYSTEEC